VRLNELGAEGWQVVGVTTKKQLFIAPPQAIILMRELAAAAEGIGNGYSSAPVTRPLQTARST
jgi:hypothetical protein